jgi:hypothetical protein
MQNLQPAPKPSILTKLLSTINKTLPVSPQPKLVDYADI